MSRPQRIRKMGDLDDLRREMWRAVLCARAILMDSLADTDTTLKAIHAMQQAGSAYGRLLEKTELQKQMDELSEAVRELRREQEQRGRR